MDNAKVITIVLCDGDPDGKRYAFFSNGLAKVYAFPKGQIANVKSEIGRPGVYLLYGIDATSGKNKVYVGESNDVGGRLQFHSTSTSKPKNFWESTVVIISQTDNLMKGHLGYIEAQLIADALRNVSWTVNNDKLTNGKVPTAMQLPTTDIITMKMFIAEAKDLVRMVGCDTFKATTGPLITEAMSVGNSAISPEFHFAGKGYSAIAVVLSVSGEWIIKAQSTARPDVQAHVSDGIRKIRQELLDAGKLKLIDGKLVFQEDCSFNSASTAASVVCGSSTNGKSKAWKLANGMTYADWEIAQSEPEAGTT